MAAKLSLIRTRLLSPSIPASDAVLDKQGKEVSPAIVAQDAQYETKVTDLTATLASVGATVSAMSWVFLRNVSESDNLVILRGNEPFRKLFGKAFMDKALATGTTIELEYSDDTVYPVKYTLSDLTRKFDACLALAEPWKVFMTEYTRITTGLTDHKVVKKASDVPASVSNVESAALSLLD